MNSIVNGITQGLIKVFRGRNFWWHVLAYALTAVLVFTGIDWWFFGVTRGNISDALGMGAGMLGFVVPVAVPLSMLAIALIRGDDDLKRNALVIVEAMIVAWIIITTYKAITGRIEPEFLAKV